MSPNASKTVDALQAVVMQACRVERIQNNTTDPDWKANLADATQSLILKMNAFYAAAKEMKSNG